MSSLVTLSFIYFFYSICLRDPLLNSKRSRRSRSKVTQGSYTSPLPVLCILFVKRHHTEWHWWQERSYRTTRSPVTSSMKERRDRIIFMMIHFLQIPSPPKQDYKTCVYTFSLFVTSSQRKCTLRRIPSPSPSSSSQEDKKSHVIKLHGEDDDQRRDEGNGCKKEDAG